MRVLQIVDNISCDSGVSTFLMNVYRNIDRKLIQFDFLVASPREKSFESEIESLGGRVYYFGNPYSIKSLFSANKCAKSFIKKNIKKYSAFHLHTSTMSLFTLKYVKLYGGQNRIVHSHSSMTSDNAIKALINRFLNLFAPIYGNSFVGCSTEAADFLFGKKSKTRKKTRIIRNAVDTEEFYFDPLIRQQNRNIDITNNNELLLLHVSNYSKIKNTDFLANVLIGCLKKRKDIKVILVGDGPEQNTMRKTLESHNVADQCIFTGRITNVKDYFNMADLFLLPSKKEGLPLTAVEAQACGLPCVLSDTITNECSAGNVVFLPLEEKKWIEYILNFSSLNEQERQSRANIFQGSELTMRFLLEEIQLLYGVKK